ncbi:MAG: hypothetical protein ACXACE_15850 [Candidatus Thorarchaeota archaeon]|jgi:hypothetical protein
MVADTAMSAKTQNILINTGFPWAFHTCRDAIGEIKPGGACTAGALTADTYDVEYPDLADDIPCGIALRNPEHDIDTAYTQWDEFELAFIGGGHLVWGRLQDSSVGKFGTKLEITVAGDGRVVSMTEANVIEQIGIQFNETATIAAEQPVMLILTPG